MPQTAGYRKAKPILQRHSECRNGKNLRSNKGGKSGGVSAISPPPRNQFLEAPAAAPRLSMGMKTGKYRPDIFLCRAATYRHNNKISIGKALYANWNPTTCAPADTSEGNPSAPGGNRIILPTIRVENHHDGKVSQNCIHSMNFTLLSEAPVTSKRSKVKTRRREGRSAFS